MARVELEFDDKGELVGQAPPELEAIFKRIDVTAHGKGYEKAVAEAKPQIAEGIKRGVETEVARLNILAPIEKQKYEETAEANKTLKAQLLEMSREHDRALKEREERHAREMLERADALKHRNGRIMELTRAQLRAEAKALGAREESLDELEVILQSSVGFKDDMTTFVKAPDGTERTVRGKPQGMNEFVKEYLDSHPHHKRPAASAGGGARGGATLHGHQAVPTIDTARARLEQGDRSDSAINDMFNATRQKSSS